jgi:hypothetical protein
VTSPRVCDSYPPQGGGENPTVTMTLAALRLLALVLPASAALCSVTASGGRLRLAGSDDLVRVAQLQLDTFDPAPDTRHSTVRLGVDLAAAELAAHRLRRPPA